MGGWAGGRVGGWAGRRVGGLLIAGLLAIAFAAPLAAQNRAPDELEQSRRRLEQIKEERERLQRQRQRLQGQVHTTADELANLERQRDRTADIVHEIERQMGTLNDQLDRSTAELVLAQDQLAERRAVMERRLADIYRRGPLYSFQVLLSAASFGDLLARYKYLYLTSTQDRTLLTDVEQLRDRVTDQRNEILSVRGQLDRSREERAAELDRFGELARQREQRLGRLRRTARQTDARLEALERDQARLNDVLASLERARREAAARAGAAPRNAGAGTITTADLGRLDWPVEGRILYRFGRDTLASGGVIRWNGIGIAADPGTTVKAVEGGTARLVGQFGTYGLTIVVEHGNGYYSIYSNLQSAAVTVGDVVAKGQNIARVGGANSDYGPHLHFEIRGENQIALDPAEWLRRR
jgi:murein hydrolase activator